MDRICLACRTKPSITVDDYAPLCGDCLDRTGDDIVLGCQVICEIDVSCSGTVERFEDEMIVVVRTAKGEAYIPRVELVRVVADDVVTVAD